MQKCVAFFLFYKPSKINVFKNNLIKSKLLFTFYLVEWKL